MASSCEVSSPMSQQKPPQNPIVSFTNVILSENYKVDMNVEVCRESRKEITESNLE